jgi:hypothetical protein
MVSLQYIIIKWPVLLVILAIAFCVTWTGLLIWEILTLENYV